MKTKDGTGIDNLDKKISYAAVGDLVSECDYAAVEGTEVAVKLINDEVLKGIIHIYKQFKSDKIKIRLLL